MTVIIIVSSVTAAIGFALGYMVGKAGEQPPK